MSFFKMFVEYLPHGFAFASLGLTTATMYPHVWGIESYKDLIKIDNKDNFDQEIFILAEEIKRDFNWKPNNFIKKDLCEIIPSSQMEFTSRGTMTSKWGAVIGTPVFFSSESIKNAQQNPHILHKYNIDLSSKYGAQLFDTFKLSRDAKKFALAREMCHVNTYQVFINSVWCGFMAMSCYPLAATLAGLLRFRRALLFSSVLVVPLVSKSFLKASSYYNSNVETKCDRLAAKISIDVAKGGVEYYDAQIKRKNMLIELSGNIESPVEIKDYFLLQSTNLSLEDKRDLLLDAIKELYPSGEI
ncbi:transmembrane protein 177-like isoform X2 [Physella acuta]|nr:transmembrane protein 177-like isoform X2 [Physella acuta]XP_059173279.1 transmembrane protein 177-like isoform X2 [Physella acuta]XP_059173281.1 transmembrane protein 177-like isoform X2 [Physella acuta]